MQPVVDVKQVTLYTGSCLRGYGSGYASGSCNLMGAGWCRIDHRHVTAAVGWRRPACLRALQTDLA